MADLNLLTPIETVSILEDIATYKYVYPTSSYTFEFDIDSLCELVNVQLNQAYTFEETIQSDSELELVGSVFIDLLKFVPEKFRDAQLFQDYLAAVGLYLGTWLSKIDDMQYLIDPYTVSDELKVTIPGQIYVVDEEYISHLASLLGLTITKSPGQTIVDFRKQLTNAIDWYKLKGTYQGMIDAIYSTGHTISIKDMYTNDYAAFVLEDWFVADYPGQNPPDLDASYYKSPHFSLLVELNQVYILIGGDPYLWKGGTTFDDIRGIVEQLRPANTVPHYVIRMTATCHEDGVMDTTTYLVKTKRIYTPWSFSRYYFDQGSVGGEWHFDEGVFLDYSATAFLLNVKLWKIGTGNRTTPPDTPGWDIETEVDSGTLLPSQIRLYADRTEWDIVIPSASVFTGLSELALYVVPTDKLVIGCTFPIIDKAAGYELRFLVIMYK
jgi:hypothetical protein